MRTTMILFIFASALLLHGEEPGKNTSEIDDTQLVGVTTGSLNKGRHLVYNISAKAKVMVIPVSDEETTKNGAMDDWQARFVAGRLARARDEGFNLVVLDIDSAASEGPAVERIVHEIRNCKVPVIAYVSRKALGGGALVALGCKAIVMAPGSEFGGTKEAHALPSNPETFAANLCDENHYPAAIARSLVNNSLELLETAHPDAEKRFMNSDELGELRVQPAILHTWKMRFQPLTFTAKQAVDTSVASGLATNIPELLTGFAVQSEAEIESITVSERVARFLSHMAWRVFFLVLAFAALFIELKMPGHGLGYIGFALCMGIFFWLQIFANSAGLAEILLFGVGMIIVAVEIFVVPTFGFIGVLGFGMILLSILLSFVPEGVSLGAVWKGTAEKHQVELLIEAMGWAALSMASIVGIVVTALLKGTHLPGLQRLALRAESAAMPQKAGVVVVDPATLAGRQGVAETVLRPSGKVRLDDVTYDAVSEGSFIDPGAPVLVMKAKGKTLVVRAL